MVEVTFRDIEIFKRVVETLTGIIEEAANFTIDAKGFGIVAQDPSHVSMIDFSMPKKAFSKFDVKKKTKLGLNLKHLNKLFKTIGAEGLTAKLDNKENKIHLEFGGEIKHRFSLNLIDIELENYPKPPKNYTAKITLLPELLKKKLEQVDLFSDHAIFTASLEAFEIFGKGDNGETKITIPVDADNVELDVKDKTIAQYSLSYLLNILKLTPVTEKLSLSFSPDMPISFEFTLSLEDGISLVYTLAPFVEEEYKEESEDYEDEEVKDEDEPTDEELKQIDEDFEKGRQSQEESQSENE